LAYQPLPVKNEDAASADGDAGVLLLAVRKGTPANTSGTDGDFETLQVSAGRLWVDASGKTLTVDGSGVTQPVSAASLPLPSGAATSAKQDTMIGHLDGVEGVLATIDADTGTIAGAVSGSEMQVDVVGSLPAGTNAIGKLAANSGVDIGDVDVLTLPGVAGTVADAATDSGNPVKTGGKYNSTQPTYTDGQRGDTQLTARGNTRVEIMSSTTAIAATTAPGDAASNSVNALSVTGYNRIYNGSTWDRVRNNEEVTLLASGARSTTQTSADITNYQGISALIVVLDMTTVGTASVTVSIEGKDSASGKYYTILTGSAITTNSTNRYRVGPTLAAAANSVAQDYLPRIFRIVVTANNGNSGTYSVGYCLLRA
jgi:hypothetical protein